MTMGRGGLFGFPKSDTGLDDAASIMFPASQRGGLFGGVAPQMLPPQQQEKPKFFGEGGAGRAIAGSIGDALLHMNGMKPIYAQTVAAQRELQMREAERQRDNEDWFRREQWKLQNQPPKINDTERDFEWYKGLSDADRAIYHQMKPEYRQGPDGRFYRVDVAPTAPVGRLTPIPDEGGPTQPASAPFRR